MSIKTLVKTRVSVTSETVVDDVEILHQKHRIRRVLKVGLQLNIPTMPTPDFSYMLRLDFMCCAKKVTELVNHPFVSLFDTRMSGTSTEMIT